MKANIMQTITKYKMCEVACKIYMKAVTSRNIISGLEKLEFTHAQERLWTENNFSKLMFRDDEPLKKYKTSSQVKRQLQHVYRRRWRHNQCKYANAPQQKQIQHMSRQIWNQR